MTSSKGASHPTVGRKIAALEAQLGTKLFARSADGLSLTSQGRKFQEHAEAMAAAALRAETAVSATGHNARGVVKLSIGATLAAHWLMPRMGTFLREHDHLQLEIITTNDPSLSNKPFRVSNIRPYIFVGVGSI